MAVHILGPQSPTRFALETALTIEGIGCVDNDPAVVSVAVPGAGDELRSADICFGEMPLEIAHRFGVERTQWREDSLVGFTCCEPVWSEHDLDILDLVSREARVPCAGRVIVSLPVNSSTETLLSDLDGNPLVLRCRNALWSTLNFPESLAILLGERYLPESANGAAGWLSTWRPLQQLYYRAPRSLRSRLQERVIRVLARKLTHWPADQFSTSYPVDATGWLLVRAMANLFRMIHGPLATIDPWPNGYRACVVVTHDIEPTRYAYRQGLPHLLNWLESHRPPPHTINPVAFEARRHMDLWDNAELGRHEVGCHGWLHDGRKTRLPRERMIERIIRAKTTIESLVDRRVTSFRSPRLDRNDVLYEALDASGFTCDSTLPDVDRENTDRWGGGCSLNFPFHPVIWHKRGWRRLNLLECPVTAPDCAMPVFSGRTEQETVMLYARKLDWVEAIGGCYVAIFHGGVFDAEDTDLRERLLEGYYELLAHRSVWRATLGELANWWRAREALSARVVHGAPVLANKGATKSPSVRLRWQGRSWLAPPLAPGAVWSPKSGVVGSFRARY